MTVLGKILAILNLVLSLVVGAFILMTFVGRTNWHAAYESMKKQAEVSQKDAQAFQDDMRKAEEETKKVREERAQFEEKTRKEKEALNAQINDLGDKYKRARAAIAKPVASQAAAGDA